MHCERGQKYVFFRRASISKGKLANCIIWDNELKELGKV
ncbi:hypothetical protein DBT_0062 [Dissulfuribacter thermophilus]|uniref:Uncharacterized protein n=1 Tax=Dissulfuribacter thermophilus TaxID=1156395 RepID=A0A1B9F8U3_9BACT|nr:hypothetical protein DBT_0062 [Dissulfuribacter thermophilus]